MDALISPRILIVGPAWVGDMVMAQSLFLMLKQRHPDCTIDVLAPAWTLPLLERMPEVTQGIAMPLGHGQFGFGARRHLGVALRGRYDWAIVLPNSWKSALTPFFAQIPRRTGYLGELRWGLLNDVRRLDKTKLPKTVQRFVALGLAQDADLPPICPEPRLQVSQQNVAMVCAKFGLAAEHEQSNATITPPHPSPNAVDLSDAEPSPSGRGQGEGCLKSPHPNLLPEGEGTQRLKSTALHPSPLHEALVVPTLSAAFPVGEGTQGGIAFNPTKILALCPGAEYGPAKRWPSAYFAEIANAKMAQGWSVWIFGSGKDQAVADEINQVAPGCVSFAGRTDLAEAVDLLSLSDVVVSNDSGLMHVAAALNKPLLAIYGSSDPDFTPPLNKQASILRLGLDCSPCFKRDCPLGHTRCLIDIKPEQVLRQLESLVTTNNR